MENEIKVGEYVRTDEGEINRITKILNDDSDVLTYYCFENNMGTLEKSIVKHSPNLIDLIQCGDYVNEMYVYGIDDYGKRKLIDTERDLFDNKDIKTIVTKEQFESISYKVERKD